MELQTIIVNNYFPNEVLSKAEFTWRWQVVDNNYFAILSVPGTLQEMN
jgi:hypothetical protein